MKQKIKLSDLTREQIRKWIKENKNDIYIEFEVELLTKEEKEYLENLLRPFKEVVDFIKKVNSIKSPLQRIYIKLCNGEIINLPYFNVNEYYKNLEVYKQYTIKDLGLFEESKYKITLTEFWNSKDKLGIHCDTEEKANKLLKAFDKIGQKWASNDSYLMINFYKYYKEKTYYTNENLYGNCESLLSKNYKIYEFDEVDLEH